MTVDQVADQSLWPLWVVEGTIDFPAKLPSNATGAQVAQLVVSLGGEDPDGFMQRPRQRDRRFGVAGSSCHQASAAAAGTLSRRSPYSRREIRARIAHGSTDWPTIAAAHANMAAVQRLACDGIALVYGIDPDTLLVMAPSPVLALAPQLKAQYSAQDNPTNSWGGFLSDTYIRYVAQAKQLVAPGKGAGSE